jgi:hypothetical protein
MATFSGGETLAAVGQVNLTSVTGETTVTAPSASQYAVVKIISAGGQAGKLVITGTTTIRDIITFGGSGAKYEPGNVAVAGGSTDTTSTNFYTEVVMPPGSSLTFHASTVAGFILCQVDTYNVP